MNQEQILVLHSVNEQVNTQFMLSQICLTIQRISTSPNIYTLLWSATSVLHFGTIHTQQNTTKIIHNCRMWYQSKIILCNNIFGTHFRLPQQFSANANPLSGWWHWANRGHTAHISETFNVLINRLVNLYSLSTNSGQCAIPSPWTLTSPCGMCGGQKVTGAGFSQSAVVFLSVSLHQCSVLVHSFITEVV